jgi:alpha-D-ribose 1-methylphosphonate 5-triphosphate synthase subunit PhnH
MKNDTQSSFKPILKALGIPGGIGPLVKLQNKVAQLESDLKQEMAGI